MTRLFFRWNEFEFNLIFTVHAIISLFTSIELWRREHCDFKRVNPWSDLLINIIGIIRRYADTIRVDSLWRVSSVEHVFRGNDRTCAGRLKWRCMAALMTRSVIHVNKATAAYYGRTHRQLRILTATCFKLVDTFAGRVDGSTSTQHFVIVFIAGIL